MAVAKTRSPALVLVPSLFPWLGTESPWREKPSKTKNYTWPLSRFPLAILWVGRVVGLGRNDLSLFHVVSAGLTPLWSVGRLAGGWLIQMASLTHLAVAWGFQPVCHDSPLHGFSSSSN